MFKSNPGELLLINPRGRRRRRKSSARRRSTAHLRKYQFSKNPRRRRQRGFVAFSMPRGRRLRAIGRRIVPSLRGITHQVATGVAGGAGAIAVDLAMGQAARILPGSVTTRFNAATGSINWPYYGVKLGLAVALGHLGARFLPGSLKSYAGAAAQGSLAVMSYEVMRTMLPATMTLGYINPATITGRGANVMPLARYMPAARLRGLRAYQRGGLPSSGGRSPLIMSQTRIGEGEVF